MLTISDFLDIYEFTTGRRLYTFKEVRAAAATLGQEDIVALCDEAIGADRETMDVERAWQKQQAAGTAAYGPEAGKVDGKVDVTVSAIERILDGAAVVLDDEAIAKQAADAKADAFPRGVGEITNKSYVEEVEAVDALVDLLGGRYGELLTTLGATRYLEQLKTYNARLRALLQAGPRKTIGWDEIKARHAAGQQYLCRLVAVALGRYSGSDSESAAGLNAVLGPVAVQNARLKEYYRTHRKVQEVDPETGAETDPSTIESTFPEA